MRAKRVVLLVCLLALFTTFSAAAAPDQEVIFRQVVAGGGGLIGDGTTLLLANTIGEPVVGPLTLAAPFKEAAGFWQDGLAGGQGGMVQSRLYLPALRR
jgi:hypothetical protein